jgi:nitroreductase
MEMDTIEALKSRHSTRAYKPRAVEKETLVKILEAANYTPSWANTQPWEIFVAADDALNKLSQRLQENLKNGVTPAADHPAPQKWPEAHMNRIMKMAAAHQAVLGISREDKDARKKMLEKGINFFGAPVVLFLCLDKTLTEWSMFDLGAVSQSIMLAAESYGLNTIPAFMMVGYPDIIRDELDIPEDLSIVLAIALGYRDPENIESKNITSRRTLDEFVRFSGI